MSVENTANAPIELPEVLQKELESFGFTPVPVDLTQPAEERLRDTYARIRALQPERSALCLSGGGIRSATFALGVVQALAKAGLLPKFDYLSTVSGGGYLGSMLTAWIHSHPCHLEGVTAELAGDGTPGDGAPEPRPLRHLRQFSNYIAPKLGLFSADGWTLVATALRNLLLNWTVLVMLLAGLLVVPWLGLLGVMGRPTALQLDLLLGAAFLCIAVSTAYPGLDLPSHGCFRWRQTWFLAGWLAPIVIAIVCLTSWWAGRSSYYIENGPVLMEAGKWMVEGNGKWCIAGFLMGASVVGILACIVIAVIRKCCRGTFHFHFDRRTATRIFGMIVASIVVIGIPGSALLWVLAVKFFPNPISGEMSVGGAVAYITFVPAVLFFGFFLMNSLFVGLTSRCSDDEDREWWARAAGWLGALVLGWLVVHGLVFWLPQWVEIYLGPAMRASIAASGGIIGFIAAKIGASDKTPAFLQTDPAAKKNLLLSGAALLFFGLLACGVSLMLDRGFFVHSMVSRIPPEWQVKDPIWWQTFRTEATFAPAKLELTVPPTQPSVLVETNAYPLARIDRQLLALPDITEVFVNPPDRWLALINDRQSFNRFGMLQQIPAAYLYFGQLTALALLGLFGTSLIMGFFINVNRFSLHATYRNRLVRAYLGAARAFDGPDGRPLRQPHPFTGFDPRDNLDMATLQHPRPLHIVNMTLNLVGGGELAWQERMADSFTASRLHCGNRRLGYRPSDEYARALSLGTALAVSGAAASPNQGYNSSALLTFLMTLFNVRLGWWLGNPGLRGSESWKKPGPAQAAFPLFAEAFGLTNEDSDYVNLSDGGHFENLGVYEMLLRRCRFLVISDAEQDGDYHFEGLGGIVRKARIDLGIVIEFQGLSAVSKDVPEAERRCFALGTVHYPEGFDGRILYIKPVRLPKMPTDVRHYAETNESFPHESTSDQFFSESQFEAYRALGHYEMTAILDLVEPAPASIAELFTSLNARETTLV